MTELPKDVLQNLLMLSRISWRARISEGSPAHVIARLEFAIKAFEQAVSISRFSPADALETAMTGLEALGESTRKDDASASALANAAEKLLLQARRDRATG